jgi:5-formyltetrahydrofolate cyclo-ligase
MMKMGKPEIRREMAARRNSLSTEEADSRSMLIMHRLIELEEYKNASVILTYVSFRNEVDTKKLIQRAQAEGKRIAVPVCIPDERVLLPCEIQSLSDLVPGTWGILEPPVNARKEVCSKEIDLAIVPGLAFDRRLNRLGYGAGYYDRFLPKLRENAFKIGICYEFQVVEQLPSDPFDISMDAIVTDLSLLRSK